MKLQGKLARFERFGTDWRRLLARGTIMLSIGALLGLASLSNPDATLLYLAGYSWLPAAALVVLAVGLLECLDAALAREQRDFFLHLQNGVLDVIVGGMIVFSVDADPARLVLLIAAFLMIKGVPGPGDAVATQDPDDAGCGRLLSPGLLDLDGMAIPGGLGPRRLSERRNRPQGMGAHHVRLLVEVAKGSAIGGLMDPREYSSRPNGIRPGSGLFRLCTGCRPTAGSGCATDPEGRLQPVPTHEAPPTPGVLCQRAGL